MKILGIGVDIIENKRIKNSIKNLSLRKEFIVAKNLAQSILSKIK